MDSITDLIRRRMRKQFQRVGIVVCLLCVGHMAADAEAQSLAVRGTIRDSQTGRPIPDVNIYIEKLQIGTSSDSTGQFVLTDSNISDNDQVIFSAVGYRKLIVKVHDVTVNPNVQMDNIVLEFGSILEVRAARMSKSDADLPLSVTFYEPKEIENSGYLHVADIVKKDVSVHLQTSLAGQQYINIRGSNEDEVLVIYDGIRLNSTGDNSFDMSLLQLNDVERIELIKGSNSSIFGSQAFGGIVNIVSRKYSDKTLKIAGRYGSNETKEITGQIYHDFKNISLFYNGGRREAEDAWDLSSSRLGVDSRSSMNDHSSIYHRVNMDYRLGSNNLSAKYYFFTYDNTYQNVTNDNKHSIAALQLFGTEHLMKDVNVQLNYRTYDGFNTQNFPYEDQTLDAEDEQYLFSIDKQIRWKPLNFYLAGETSRNEFRGISTRIVKTNNNVFITDNRLDRNHSSANAILKFQIPLANRIFQDMSWDMGLRYDDISEFNSFTTYKIGVAINGRHNNQKYQWYFSNGTNVKFPTLNQIFIAQTTILTIGDRVLKPEENTSYEFGLRWSNNPGQLKWWDTAGFSLSYFHNNYLNKIGHLFRISGVGYYNARTVTSSGLEGGIHASFMQGLLGVRFGILLLNISNEKIYPFKPDNKLTLDFYGERSGFSVNMHMYRIGEQKAILDSGKGWETYQTTIASHYDLDIHVKKEYQIRDIKLFSTLSAFNLRNQNESVLSYYIVKDRRVFITTGMYLW